MKGTNYSTFECIRDYWILLEGQKVKFVFFSFMRSLSNIASFLIFYCLGLIIDFFTKYNTGQSLYTFYFLSSLISFSAILQVWLRMHAKLKLHIIGANLRMKTRTEAMERLVELDLKWHEKEETGSKIQRINNGGDAIYKGIDLFSNFGLNTITDIFTSLSLLLIINVKYGLFAFIYILIYFSGEYYFNKKLIHLEDERNKIQEKVSGKFHESASNLLTVKSLGLENVFKKSTLDLEKEFYKIWLQTKRLGNLKSKIIKIFAAFGFSAFIFLIGFDVTTGLITVGSILILSNYFSKLKNGLEEISNNLNDFISVKSGIGRFMYILGVNLKRNGNLEFPTDWKQIKFENVSFKYKNRFVIQNLNLTINRNQAIGLVGKSGCGKSTLVKLLLGIYTPQKGRILVDDVDIKKINQKSFRTNIGVVLQDSEMFNISLFNNITFFPSNLNEKLFRKAIEISQLKELIQKLPLGLNTLVGEKGYKVSGGERQRIGISRTIYKNPPILILDEATSHLDSKTESKIQKGIEEQLKEKTLIIIAHRLSTLKNVEKIYVMNNGRIVEQRTFNFLIKNKGKFSELHKLQTR